MNFKDELMQVIRKKALGFSYTEETIECETTKPKPYVLCEKSNRLYMKNGYIIVKKRLKNGEICEILHKPCVKFVEDKNLIKKFLPLD